MSDRAGWTADGRPLLAGKAAGELLALEAPLSLWGGFDPATGLVIDGHHPQHGECLSGRIVALSAGRGSSSSSSVLAEAIRAGTAPAALLLSEPDGILLIGALVGAELTGRRCPVVVLPASDHRRLRSGDVAELDETGRLAVSPPTR